MLFSPDLKPGDPAEAAAALARRRQVTADWWARCEVLAAVEADARPPAEVKPGRPLLFAPDIKPGDNLDAREHLAAREAAWTELAASLQPDRPTPPAIVRPELEW